VPVTNGREVLDALAEQGFDVVLMDVQMPEMDGFEATAAIRERERSSGKHATIIAMTAHAMKGDRERCFEAGMDGYVSKPLLAEALYAAIEGRQAATSASPAPAAALVEPAPLDEEALREHFGDDALLKEVAGVFVETCPTWQAEIRAAVEAQDAAKVRITAHTIKGAVSHFGAQDAYEAAHQLEQMGKGGQLQDAPAACAALERALQRLQSALQAICEQ